MSLGQKPASHDVKHEQATTTTGTRLGHMLTCRCAEIRRLDGEKADRYIHEHLRLIERGRDPTGADDIEWTVGLLSERSSIDWWERGAPKR